MKRALSVLFLRFLFTVIFLALTRPLCSNAQSLSGSEVIFPVTIQWARQKAIARYRLQIAADEKFENVYLDKRVFGNTYTVKDLSSGYYYWRVTNAESQPGTFSRPMRFFISGGVVTPVILTNRSRVPNPAVRPRSD